MMPFYATGRIGETASLVFALATGLVFGWFLERGGLGNARKLAGQFYLRDMTVFKVMFSAILTAMLGLFWLSRVGILDNAALYVPETFVVPQLVGGLVFGVGFVTGGLCPGTSCVAASSGRKDGLVVMLGMCLGIFAFAEAWPWLRDFQESTPLGTVTLPAMMGIPAGVLVFAVTLTAIALFAVATRVERRFRGMEVDG
jgi:uncharacterized protein